MTLNRPSYLFRIVFCGRNTTSSFVALRASQWGTATMHVIAQARTLVLRYNGQPFIRAYAKHECANPLIDCTCTHARQFQHEQPGR
eukprot:38392-Eustigmatos_ZCMA.PRE.1